MLNIVLQHRRSGCSSPGQTSGLAWCIPPGQRKQSSVRPGSSHRGSAESRRRSMDGRRLRDPVHPSVRSCNPRSTATTCPRSRSYPGRRRRRNFQSPAAVPQTIGLLGTPGTPPCGAATLAARPPPVPAPHPIPAAAAEIFRVPPPFRRRSAGSGPLPPLCAGMRPSQHGRRLPPLPALPPGHRRNFQSPAAVP